MLFCKSRSDTPRYTHQNLQGLCSHVRAGPRKSKYQPGGPVVISRRRKVCREGCHQPAQVLLRER